MNPLKLDLNFWLVRAYLFSKLCWQRCTFIRFGFQSWQRRRRIRLHILQFRFLTSETNISGPKNRRAQIRTTEQPHCLPPNWNTFCGRQNICAFSDNLNLISEQISTFLLTGFTVKSTGNSNEISWKAADFSLRLKSEFFGAEKCKSAVWNWMYDKVIRVGLHVNSRWRVKRNKFLGGPKWK